MERKSEIEEKDRASTEGVEKQGDKAEQDKENKEGKRQYKFAWDEKEEEYVSDVTISSVHTSDLSSFIDGEDSSEQEVSEKEAGKIGSHLVHLFLQELSCV